MPIIRVFRATIRPGMNSEFKDFFLNDAVSIVRAVDGCLSVEVGLPFAHPDDEASREFHMTTIWRDLDAIKRFAGENWQEAYIAPEEAHMIESAEVHHFDQADV